MISALLLVFLPWAGAQETPHSDLGLDVSNPYDYETNITWTEAPVQGMRELYADPAAFVRALVPAAPVDLALSDPLQGKASPMPVLGAPDPKLYLQVHPARLSDAGVDFDALVAALRAAGVQPSSASPDQMSIAIPVDNGAAGEQLAKELGAIELAGVSLTRLCDPVVSLMGSPSRQPTGPIVKPGPMVPATGNLVLVNRASGWASISINGAQLGVLGPLARATISGVRSGQYDIGYTLTTGYTWSERISTCPACTAEDWPPED